MNRERLKALIADLTHITVLGQLLSRVRPALSSVRGATFDGRVLSMDGFIAAGMLRYLRDDPDIVDSSQVRVEVLAI